jgi:tripartite ATP-independent transporter DctM subunit
MLAAAKLVLGIGTAEAGGAKGHGPPALRLGAMAQVFHSAMDVVDAACRVVLLVLFSGELGMILVEVCRRQLVGQSFLWSEEISRIILLTLAFIGGPLAYRGQSHAAVSFITRSFPPTVKSTIEAGIDVLILGIGLLTVTVSLDLFEIDAMSILPMTQWNLAVIVVPFTAGMSFTALFALERLVLRHRPAAVLRAVAAIGVLIAVVLVVSWVPSLRPGKGYSLLLMLAAFFTVVLLGLPVAFSMLTGTILYLSLTDVAPMVAAAQNTIDGAGLFVLLTVPFFIWAGLIMERGGISVRLVRFAMALVGHLRGGLLQVVIMTTYLVSGVSGSKLADVVAVGSVMREQLARKGYRARDGAGVLAAATAMSETIPPSIAMLVLGSVVPVSIGSMFVAGLLPAAALAVILMILVWFMAIRNPTAPVPRADRRERVGATLGALLPACMPAILIVGIKGGIATPTEVSSVAVFYGMILAVLVYRQMDWRSFVKIAVDSAVMSGMVLFMIAAAGSFAWVMSAGNMPQYLVAFLHSAGENKYVFLAGSIVIVIVVGSLLEGIPSLIILGPILYPVATHLGIEGVHYAIVLLLAMGVGIFVPPLGIGFFVSCSVMHASVEDTSKAVVPYMLALLMGILLLAYVPWFSLALLNAIGR